jgi:2-(1,2-epoxy-1,2-dihydrophenyl)acetyl-CoA isomerase
LKPFKQYQTINQQPATSNQKKVTMSTVLFEKIGNVAKITLNRPEAFNSFNREMSLELQRVLDECKEDAEVRAIYLTGMGKAFCAGQDLKEITGEDAPELSTILGEHFNPIVMRLHSLEKPIIGAINGVAAGAGANFAMGCDITVAKASAVFIQAFSKIGLIPDSGGTYFLPRLVGRQRAAALMMLGEKVTAADAADMGMIYKAIPDESFEKESWEMAVTLSQMPTKALGLIKRALNYSPEKDLEHQLDIEDHLQSEAGLTYDFKEGVQAFLEKRKPVFKGE